MASVDEERTGNGVPFKVLGVRGGKDGGGAEFTLLPIMGVHHAEDVIVAKWWLQDHHDVVGRIRVEYQRVAP